MLTKMLTFNTPQFWSAVRLVAVAVSSLLAGFGIQKIAGVDIVQVIDRAIAVGMAVLGLVGIIVAAQRGQAARSPEQLAKDAADVAPKETALRLMSHKPAETLQAIAESPAVAEIKTTSSAIANAVPSDKVVFDPASPRY